jgi:N-acetylglucosamine-6-phosphate deacetylase
MQAGALAYEYLPAAQGVQAAGPVVDFHVEGPHAEQEPAGPQNPALMAPSQVEAVRAVVPRP